MIIRNCLPEKLIDSCQDMGRSGRGRKNDGLRPTDFCHFILSMADRAHLLERIFGKSREQNQNVEVNENIFYTNLIISNRNSISFQRATINSGSRVFECVEMHYS